MNKDLAYALAEPSKADSVLSRSSHLDENIEGGRY